MLFSQGAMHEMQAVRMEDLAAFQMALGAKLAKVDTQEAVVALRVRGWRVTCQRFNGQLTVTTVRRPGQKGGPGPDPESPVSAPDVVYAGRAVWQLHDGGATHRERAEIYAEVEAARGRMTTERPVTRTLFVGDWLITVRVENAAISVEEAHRRTTPGRPPRPGSGPEHGGGGEPGSGPSSPPATRALARSPRRLRRRPRVREVRRACPVRLTVIRADAPWTARPWQRAGE